MFITAEEVMASTPYTDITNDQVRQANFIIEAYVGRTESEVDNARDLALLARATAFQAVYMRQNPEIVYEQAKVQMLNAGGNMTTFDTKGDAPFIAPLAEKVCKKLSWRGTRSVRTGTWHQRQTRVEWV